MEVQANRVIGDAGITGTATGISIDIRLPWYRSLPLSTVEVDSVEIDGEAIAPERIVFELENKRYSLAELEEQTTHVWYILDSAHLLVDGLALKADRPHQVAVTLVLYPPYIRGLKRPVRDNRTLTLKPEAHDA